MQNPHGLLLVFASVLGCSFGCAHAPEPALDANDDVKTEVVYARCCVSGAECFANAERDKEDVARSIWWHSQACGFDEQFCPVPTISSSAENTFVPEKAEDLDAKARVRRRWKPYYPRELVGRNVQGTVVLDVSINRLGEFRGAKFIENVDPLLDRLALKAVQKSYWNPAVVDCSPVDSTIRHSVKFVIGD